MTKVETWCCIMMSFGRFFLFPVFAGSLTTILWGSILLILTVYVALAAERAQGVATFNSFAHKYLE